MAKNKTYNDELLSLMNVGAATCRDLQLLEINSIHQLADACADELYARLQRITGQSHDPCVWDIFAAVLSGNCWRPLIQSNVTKPDFNV